MNIEMALKSRSYILDLDRVMLSLGIFFFLSFFHQPSGSTLIFCQKHTPKSRKFNVWPNFTHDNDCCVVPWRAMYLKDFCIPVLSTTSSKRSFLAVMDDLQSWDGPKLSKVPA